MSESEKSAGSPAEKRKYPIYPLAAPVVTEHVLGDLKYTATTGMLPINDEFGEAEAGIFYVAYTKSDVEDVAHRPVIFTFNGGPGSSSVWLHLGAVGPKRVEMKPDGDMPAPPYRLVDNPETWLHHADLVFIDPVGTGYSRATKEDGDKAFWGLEGDLKSVGEFIRLFLTRFGRWSSPLYLAGESYGTTRATGLAGKLIESGIAFNGIILVSSILNFQTARFDKGNDLPYVLFLPTYTATAFFHGKLDFPTLESALAAAEAFAENEYPIALAKGDRLTANERSAVVSKLKELTGLTEEYIDQTELRVNIHRFCKELLRTQKRTVGRIDSRFQGIDELAATESPDHDPSMSIITPPYTAMINDYIRRVLGYETDQPYYVFNPGKLWANWTYGDAKNGYPDTSESLRNAMTKNPFMKVFVASGYFDLATPYYATEYTLAHLGLDPSLRKNISTKYYAAGHMMYIHEECLSALARDVAEFLN